MHEFLPKRLRAARLKLNLSQAQAAQHMGAGITQPILHRAETLLNLSSNRLLQIIDYYINQQQINPAWLLCERNEAYDWQSIDVGNGPNSQQKLQLLEAFRRELDELDKPDL